MWGGDYCPYQTKTPIRGEGGDVASTYRDDLRYINTRINNYTRSERPISRFRFYITLIYWMVAGINYELRHKGNVLYELDNPNPNR